MNLDAKNINVPFLDLKKQYYNIKEKINRAIFNILKNGTFIMGKPVEIFEENISRYLGQRSLGCASGSDSLLLSLITAGIKPGDEIITTPFTFFATAGFIARLGSIPVFVDVQENTFNIDPMKIKDAISSKTKAIIPVHIFGLPAEMDEILNIATQNNLIVIEDACQSIGAVYRGQKVGTIGDFGCFSFYPTKNLGCYGDGGLITTGNLDYYNYLKKLRVHGSKEKYYHEFIGLNSRLDAIQAAVLNVKLDLIDDWNNKRRMIAKQYTTAFSDILTLQSSPDYSNHVYHQYAILTEEKKRNPLLKFLKKNNIDAGIYYPLPLHLQHAFSKYMINKGDLPISESISKKIISIPIFPEMEQKQIDFVIDCVKLFFK